MDFEVKLPVIPEQQFLITDYGAVMGGKVSNTQAFARAITAAEKAGGGTVVIPAGIWLTGPISSIPGRLRGAAENPYGIADSCERSREYCYYRSRNFRWKWTALETFEGNEGDKEAMGGMP